MPHSSFESAFGQRDWDFILFPGKGDFLGNEIAMSVFERGVWFFIRSMPFPAAEGQFVETMRGECKGDPGPGFYPPPLCLVFFQDDESVVVVCELGFK